MTTQRFRKLFDANLYEIFWLQEVGLNDKLASVRELATERISFLQRENQDLDKTYYEGMSLHEPIKYDTLQHYLRYAK